MAFPLNRRQLLGAGLAAAIPSAHEAPQLCYR